MDAAVAAGIDFFDAAEMYAMPPTAARHGSTETIIGQWFRARPGRHERIVLATKVAGRSDSMSYIRDTRQSPSQAPPRQIEEAIHAQHPNPSP